MTIGTGGVLAAAQTGRQAGFVQGLFLILGGTLSVMGVIVLAPVLPQLMIAFRDVPDAAFWVPALISVAGLGAAAFAPFAGFVGDRFGRVIPLVIFCMAFAVLGVVPFILDDFWFIFAARVGIGVAWTAILVLSTALIGDYFSGDSLNRWLGGQAVAATASALVYLPLGGLLGSALGWRGPFLAFAIGLPLALAYWVFFRNVREVGEENGSSQVGWSALPWPWLGRVCFVSVLAGILLFALQLQIGLALAAIGITDAARIGLLSGIAFVGIPLGAILFVPLASWPFRRLICLELLVLGVSLMLLRAIEDYRIFLAVVFINLMAGGMMLPTFITHVTQNLEGSVRARGIGVWQACFPLSQFLAVAICSLVLQWPGTDILDSFCVLGLIGVAAAVVGWFGARGRRISMS